MRKATTLLTVLASLLFYAFALSTPASADPGGNNGDVKIHDTGTAVQDNRNEPHVCNFYIDGFNFDGGSSGSWRIEGWAPTGSGVKSSNSWGPADAAGNWHSNPISLPDGHYKLFVKQTSPMTPGGEKQKVFWVECNSSTTTSGVTPTTTGTTNTSRSTPTPTVAGFQQNNSATGAVTPTVELPGGSSQQSPTGAVNGVQTAPVAGVQGLPSTSTDDAPTIPVAALGVALVGLGGARLRRRDTQA
jgi:MYXO-CTERM domain-containing protein